MIAYNAADTPEHAVKRGVPAKIAVAVAMVQLLHLRIASKNSERFDDSKVEPAKPYEESAYKTALTTINRWLMSEVDYPEPEKEGEGKKPPPPDDSEGTAPVPSPVS